MPQMPVTIYTASGCLFSEQAKAWLSEAGICYTEIDTTADPAKVEEMKRWAGGTWVFPTIVIGQEVGLGFDPEWIQARLGLEVQGAFTGGTLVAERRARTRNGIVERLAQAELSPQENDIRKAILKAFAQDGTAPSVGEVAQALGLPLEDVLAGFQSLPSMTSSSGRRARHVSSARIPSQGSRRHIRCLPTPAHPFMPCAPLMPWVSPSCWARERAFGRRVFSVSSRCEWTSLEACSRGLTPRPSSSGPPNGMGAVWLRPAAH